MLCRRPVRIRPEAKKAGGFSIPKTHRDWGSQCEHAALPPENLKNELGFPMPEIRVLNPGSQRMPTAADSAAAVADISGAIGTAGSY